MKRTYCIAMESRFSEISNDLTFELLYKDIHNITKELNVIVFKIVICQGLLNDSFLAVKCSRKNRELLLERLNNSYSGHYIRFFYK